MKTTPEGTHISRPPSCWSSKGVSPHANVVFRYAGYQMTVENVSSAPRALQCTAVAKTYNVAVPKCIADLPTPYNADQNSSALRKKLRCWAAWTASEVNVA